MRDLQPQNRRPNRNPLTNSKKIRRHGIGDGGGFTIIRGPWQKFGRGVHELDQREKDRNK